MLGQSNNVFFIFLGLPPTGSWQDLKDHMREAGDVCFADVYKDGTGVCEYVRYEDMKYALKKLDDTKFKSHEVSVEIAKITWNQFMLHNTVWKCHDFSTTQILREIKFGDPWCEKSAIFTHLEALNFDFYEFFQFFVVEIYQIKKIQSPKIAKNGSFFNF